MPSQSKPLLEKTNGGKVEKAEDEVIALEEMEDA